MLDLAKLDFYKLKSEFLNMSAGDTVSVDVVLSPSTAILKEDMIECHQLYLLKELPGGGKIEPTEYKITSVEKVATSEDNIFHIIIADTDAGHGYYDKVQLCYQKGDYSVISPPIEIRNSGSTLTCFSLSDGSTIWDSFDVRNDTIRVQVPQSFNLKEATAYFKHNGAYVSLNDEIQESGIGKKDYTDFCNPKVFNVKAFDGRERKYTIEIFNIPIVFINTPDSIEITSRYEWIGNSSFTIRNTDGIEEDYGEANVRGRGNWTWRQGLESGKKPYAVKLSIKPKNRTVLGMPGHKRWILLSNPVSYLPNPVGFEVNRRAETCKWSPRSRFVELILNGKHQGLYLLCEQIKIDKNRININEMKNDDTVGEAVTGGYLISYDDAWEDDDPIYRTKYYNIPFMIKNPDTDDINPDQLNYITNYINEAELSLYDDEKFNNGEYNNYFDVDSWIDYYFAAELWGALEMKEPRSVWLYKDRGGLLTAGPLWDMESNFFHNQQLYCSNSLYYDRLFQSRDVVDRLKTKWKVFRTNIVGNGKYDSILEYIDSLYEECRFSADRDRKMTPASFYGHLPYEESKLELEYHTIHDNIMMKLDWLENQIMSW